MIQGGGFCELHGPFDPPNLVCPYCAMLDEQRKVYGPPGGAPARTADASDPPADPAPATELEPDFVRRTVEPEPEPLPVSLQTEFMPRPSQAGEEPGEDADAGPGTPLLGWLIVREPLQHRGAILAVQANQSIGREGDVRWDDPRLSRLHARLTIEPAQDAPQDGPVFHLWPFGPTNPVYINGNEIRGATPLHENDEIRLGDTLFVFKVLTG